MEKTSFSNLTKEIKDVKVQVGYIHKEYKGGIDKDFPDESNWYQEAEIKGGFYVYPQTKEQEEKLKNNPSYRYNSKYGGYEHFEWHLKNQSTLFVKGMLTGFTKPYRLLANGGFGDNSLLEEKNKEIGTSIPLPP